MGAMGICPRSEFGRGHGSIFFANTNLRIHEGTQTNYGWQRVEKSTEANRDEDNGGRS